MNGDCIDGNILSLGPTMECHHYILCPVLVHSKQTTKYKISNKITITQSRDCNASCLSCHYFILNMVILNAQYVGPLSRCVFEDSTKFIVDAFAVADGMKLLVLLQMLVMVMTVSKTPLLFQCYYLKVVKK